MLLLKCLWWRVSVIPDPMRAVELLGSALRGKGHCGKWRLTQSDRLKSLYTTLKIANLSPAPTHRSLSNLHKDTPL